MTIDTTTLRDRAEAEGQAHLFQFWDGLDAGSRERLLVQVADLDWGTIRHLKSLLDNASDAHAAPAFEPPELFPLLPKGEFEERARQAILIGQERLSAGLVGYVLVAGGQGSRLGFDGPKGAFPVGPVTRISLFAWHAARLKAAHARSGAPIRWYVMTSATNDAATRQLFLENGNFGLPADAVTFFQQAMLPALDLEGRIILAAPDQLFLAPNGHGGTLAALRESGCLADAAERGIETLSYFQVDNPMARMADPLFLGLHAAAGAEMSSKVVAKVDAGEKVGVLGRADGVLGCIEYSDLPEALREARDDAGDLVFRAGNIAMHAIERDFVERLTGDGPLQLPWHLARKSMDAVLPDGSRAKVDGVKFETFVFDALARTSASITLEVDRASEFSPVKNSEGPDSPATCKRDMTDMFRGWLAEHGQSAAPMDAGGDPNLEIDPTFAETAAEFAARMPATPTPLGGGLLYR
tara:strand:+ start:1790 stop:3193 length:1404 start_codon:yes stop_codon:yes gene_type:complete